MYEKYYVIKKLYPKYIVMITKKNKLYTFNIDKCIVKRFGYKKTDHIIENNFELKKFDKYNYDEYYAKIKLINHLEKIKKEIKSL